MNEEHRSTQGIRSRIRTPYRQYKAATDSRATRTLRYSVVAAALAYPLLLCFPQVLFAHEVSYRDFAVYSRVPLSKSMEAVLDKAETRLAASEINNPALKPRIFLAGGFRSYALWSLNLGANSFGKSYPLLPTSNVFINHCDPTKDAVFRRSATARARSLSGVIAHETTHLLIRRQYGYWRNLTLPTWKKEGYAEYVAGGSTLPYETGANMWKAHPKDGTGYQYFKYYMMVKYLLDQEHLSVDELFTREFDVPALEKRVFETL